jgi:hypothetical protein
MLAKLNRLAMLSALNALFQLSTLLSRRRMASPDQ